MFSLKTESPGRLAFLGVLATAVGIAAIVWPGVTIGVAVALFAIYCFTNAIGQLVAMFAVEKSVGRDVLRLVLALIDVAAGVVALVYPGITAEVLVFIVGFWAFFALVLPLLPWSTDETLTADITPGGSTSPIRSRGNPRDPRSGGSGAKTGRAAHAARPGLLEPDRSRHQPPTITPQRPAPPGVAIRNV
jgi:Short repeat of unknown function (DUF308)